MRSTRRLQWGGWRLVLLMRLGYLHGEQCARIPIRIGRHDGNTLIECHDAAAFLRTAVESVDPIRVSPETFIRGVFRPGKGASFQLFDTLGTVSQDILTLTDEEARILLDHIC